ncbi:hypothetical protein ANCCAN_12802 [Ancylostoma caninum]|uniref:Uncharacterized protein n=1 Tax=Ancylostoma caninum TaxID=29170 RepID=A0A368GDZ4_ANCCA|nr:hypothetical protein ANCCAN_12802 [Ancylostoma caninum]
MVTNKEITTLRSTILIRKSHLEEPWNNRMEEKLSNRS